MTPVTIRATGTVSQSSRKYLSNIAGRKENSHIGHCTRAVGSADATVQNM